MKDGLKTIPPEEKLLRAIFGWGPEGPQYLSEVNGVSLKQAIDDALVRLKPRHVEIMRTRFGFDNPSGKGRTLEETGKAFGITRERIHYIEMKCLRLLRHPSCSRQLKAYLGDEGADEGN